jgi:thiol-disulfide isomerase/thioredoxin
MMTRWCLVVSIAGLTLSLPALSAAAQGTTAPAPKPDATKILQDARAALAKVDALSYDAVVTGSGGLDAPEVRAQVSMAKAEAGGWRVYTKGTSGTNAFEVAFDGVQARSVKEADKVVFEKSPKDPADTTELMVFFSGQSAKHPIAWELIAKEPLKAVTSTIEGEATVAGEACHIVNIPAPAVVNEGAADADFGSTLLISKRDHLPRRIARKVSATGEQLRILTLENFKTNSDSIGAAYSLQVPDGYAVKQADVVKKKKAVGGGPREADQPVGGAGVGNAAPAFSLKDVKGKEHTLADYKGKVVVLDFWATWCPPCRDAMPGLQRLHTKFQGKDVAILGINVGETADEAAAYMKKNKFTYGLLLGGEKLAEPYQIRGIPVFVVIGKDGKVLWKAVGHGPTHEKDMADIIEKELAK